MTSKRDAISIAGRMQTMTQQTSHWLVNCSLC